MPGPAFAILRLHVACSDPGRIEEGQNMVNQISDFKFAVSPEASASVHDENLGTRDGDIQFADVVANLAGVNEDKYAPAESRVDAFPGIVGQSAALRNVLQQIEMVVLIRITRIHQNHQFPPKLSAFRRDVIVSSVSFQNITSGTRFALRVLACRW
jgi:hypothetical protein